MKSILLVLLGRVMFPFFIPSTQCICIFFALLMPVTALANDSDWEKRFAQAVLQHPDIQAAQAELEASRAQAKVLGSAVYNPELDTELESEGSDTNFRVDLSQTLDWWGKRDVQSRQAESLITEARSRYRQRVLQRFEVGLRALADYAAARRSLQLTEAQEIRQSQLLELIEQRQQAGDLGQVDAELAYLGLVQKKAESAKANAELIRSQALIETLLPGLSLPYSIPDQFWQKIDRHAENHAPDQWVQQHPAIVQAKANWERRKGETRLSRLQAKADPSVGIGAGRSGDDNVFALTLSIPLYVRNDFSSTIVAANEAETSARAEYQAKMQHRLAEIKASRAVMRQYAMRHAEWQAMMKGRETRNEGLLERLWSSGELSTTEYLTFRQQASEALATGLELRAGLDQARIDWIALSGQVQALLPPPTEQ